MRDTSFGIRDAQSSSGIIRFEDHLVSRNPYQHSKKMVNIAHISLPDFPLLLAPMEDVSDPPFRAVCKDNGADLMYTEFISSEGLIRDAIKSRHKLDIFEYEKPVGIQIFGGDEESLSLAAKIVEVTNPDLPGRHLSPDHTLGDENTIGGYARVHARPAAFEGSDGHSYSVSLQADATADAAAPFGAYFLFLRWRRRGTQGVETHLETEYLEHADSADVARELLGQWLLVEVKGALEGCIRAAGGGSERRWWDVMRDDEESGP